MEMIVVIKHDVQDHLAQHSARRKILLIYLQNVIIFYYNV